jgi:hypothetical protein
MIDREPLQAPQNSAHEASVASLDTARPLGGLLSPLERAKLSPQKPA